MHVTCPQCHATYELNDDVHDALLICHRCKTEFSTHTMREPQVSPHPTPIEHADLNPSHPAPKRKKARLWPWLMAVLLMISAWGVQYNQELWLQQPWVRNMLAQLHYPLHAQASDWRILKDESHRQWMTRQDGSRILLLTGVIQNRLNAPLLPPKLKVSFYAASNAPVTQSMILPITLPPSLPQIRHAPYTPPKLDKTPIAAHGKREFTLVFEHVPEQSREISIEVSIQ